MGSPCHESCTSKDGRSGVVLRSKPAESRWWNIHITNVELQIYTLLYHIRVAGRVLLSLTLCYYCLAMETVLQEDLRAVDAKGTAKLGTSGETKCTATITAQHDYQELQQQPWPLRLTDAAHDAPEARRNRVYNDLMRKWKHVSSSATPKPRSSHARVLGRQALSTRQVSCYCPKIQGKGRQRLNCSAGCVCSVICYCTPNIACII